MKEKPKFLDILLNMEVQRELHDEHFIMIPEIGEKGKEKLKKILQNLAWRHVKSNDHEMGEYIAYNFLGTRTLYLMLEIGLTDVFLMETEKLDNILSGMGFKKGIFYGDRDIQHDLIIGAAKAILDGHSFNQLKGFKRLIKIPLFPKSDCQMLIDKIKKLPLGHCQTEWRSKEIPKLTRFLKNSVFIEK